MSIQSTLENLRSKPEHVRSRIAFWTSFGVTAIIFVFWLSSFTAVRSSASDKVASVVEKAGTPSSSLVANVGDLFVDIKEIFLSPRKIEYAEVEVLPGS